MKIHIAVALLLMASAAAKLTEMLGDSSDLLAKGKYAEAMLLDDKVIREMGEYYVSGDATTQLFTIAVVHKALAYAGLGKEDDALWYWYAAAGLYPAIARSDMSSYGAAGKFLAAHPPKFPEVSVPRGAQIVAAEIVKKVEPKYPPQSLNAGVQGPIEVEFIVGRDGRAHTPRVVGTIGAPMVVFATLEAVRQWQFKPATADGQPIDAPTRLTMNYKIR